MIFLVNGDYIGTHEQNRVKGSGWEYMVQIEGPITPESWEGVPSQGGQSVRGRTCSRRTSSIFFFGLLKNTNL